jgi:dTMP kinase
MTRRSRPAGFLVAIEGIDGSGKSTLRGALARELRRRGWAVGLWREPSRPAIGRTALALAPVDPVGAAIHFTLDRLLARPRLERLLRARDLVLSDRSFYSTLAYQGSDLPPRGRRALERLQRSVARSPDLVLWVDLPVDEALRRIGIRGAPRAPVERRRTLRRVSASYRAMARSPGWVRLDGRAPVRGLTEAAAQAVASRGSRRGRLRRKDN